MCRHLRGTVIGPRINRIAGSNKNRVGHLLDRISECAMIPEPRLPVKGQRPQIEICNSESEPGWLKGVARMIENCG